MSRLPPWILVMAVWAAIYLPALGSFEIKGEEGRRILPAISMLETGNYVVPLVGSGTYFSKPPLVNWLIAASFKVTGIRSEWTARLPSVLSVLAVALAFITIARPALGARGGTIAALIWLTIIGLIEKGRLIEIEAVYVSLSSLAIVCWMSWWLSKRSPWLTWTVPWIFLGLGWLAKGPLHLIFFYAVVVAVLWQTKRLKTLFHPAHFIGLLIMLGIFAAWAIPFLQMSGQGRALTKWSAQFTGRASPQFFSLRAAILTLARAIGQFLPWLIFIPLLRFGRFDETEKRLARALVWSSAVPLIAVSLIPVSSARYSLPVAAPFCWLMALAFNQDAFARLPWFSVGDRTMWKRLGQPIVAVVVISSLILFCGMSQLPNKHEKVKSIAGKINALVPETETLYAVDPAYQPFLFYVRAPVKYLDRLEQVPDSARYVMVRPNRETAIEQSERWFSRRPRPVLRLTDYREQTVTVYELAGSGRAGD